MENIKEVEKTLYKRDSKGKFRQLTIMTSQGHFSQQSGLVGGNLVMHRSISKPKNVGKANETTSQTQAISEAHAKIATKLDEGYFETQEEALNTVVVLPMLAKDYNKEKRKVVYPCFAQPKLDGMRALYSKSTLISRKGKKIETMQHIIDDVANSTGYVLDGELYAHGLSFQDNMKIIKKVREGTENVKFHVYDLISTEPFSARCDRLTEIVADYEEVELVPTYMLKSEEDLINIHKRFIKEGYEGTIVRHSDAGYGVNKRDSQLLKYKDFIDKVYKVIDVVPSDKDPEMGVIHCQMDTGETFGCGMKFSHVERILLLHDKHDYIGKMAEIRFFEFTDGGLPRFPVCHGFRLDK